jgi:hypothetical protein
MSARRRAGPALFAAALAALTYACASDHEDEGAAARRQAALDYPTFRELHAAVVLPTCGPRSGVCHNGKQYPDLHSPTEMLAAVGKRCNAITADPLAILDACEPAGDELVLGSVGGGFRAAIGRVRAASDGQAIEIDLEDAVPTAAESIEASIERAGPPAFVVHLGARVTTRAGEHTVIVRAGDLPDDLRSFLAGPYVPGLATRVVLGDPNANGVFGAGLGELVIRPGDPERSFLVQRILGKVLPRMPLANGDLTPAQIFALACWVRQMHPDGSNADGPIDYRACDSVPVVSAASRSSLARHDTSESRSSSGCTSSLCGSAAPATSTSRPELGSRTTR